MSRHNRFRHLFATRLGEWIAASLVLLLRVSTQPESHIRFTGYAGEEFTLTRTQLWLLFAAVPLVLVSVARSAGCQEVEAPSVQRDATHIDYSKSHGFPHVFAPYAFPSVPEPRLADSRRLQDLIVDGKLTLSLEDAIALALENNGGIAVARFELPIAQTDLLRAKGGGATRGVGSTYQSTTLFSGSLGGGVGSGAATGGSGAGGILGGGINSVGSTSCCDPRLSVSYGWSNAITPLNYKVVSGVSINTTHQASVAAAYSQGFLTGTSLFVSEDSSRLSSNSTTAIYDPEQVSSLSAGVSQHLLRGFGTRANTRFIRIGRNDLKYSMSIFRQRTIVAVAEVMTAYYDLLSDRESILVAQEGLDHAQRLTDHKVAEVGSAAEYDELRSQEEVALRQQDLQKAQDTFSQDAKALKVKLCRDFNEDLATAEVVPSDRLLDPQPADVPLLAEALRQAASHRPEIEQAEMDLSNQAVVIEAIHNSLLPSLDVYASYSLSGLSGALGHTFTNIFEGDYPNFSYGLTLNLPIRNRTAQADAARALLEQRQLQMKLQDAKNQTIWNVSKALSAVEQARGQLASAQKLVKLARQVLEMRRQRHALPSADVEDAITAQHNLSAAQARVIEARVTYAKALIQYEVATGTLLDRNNIALSDAVDGAAAQVPDIPRASGPPE
jgi:outer membrane protein TolC